MWTIVMEQGGGCDYTIGCGIAFESLAADTLEEAIEEAREFFLSEEGCHYLTGEMTSIASARLVQDNNNDLPIDMWRSELANQRNLEKKILKEEEERKEFERLKKKFEKNK